MAVCSFVPGHGGNAVATTGCGHTAGKHKRKRRVEILSSERKLLRPVCLAVRPRGNVPIPGCYVCRDDAGALEDESGLGGGILCF